MILAQILFVITLVIICLLALIYIRAYFDPLRKIPGWSLTNPIFGHLASYLREGCPLLKYVKEETALFGHIRINYLFFGKVRLCIGSQYWIKQILNSKNYERGDFYGFENMYIAVGENGLIVVNGEVHKKLRKLASPAFKHSSLKKVMPTIEMCGERMVQLFKTSCNESKCEIAEIGVKEILNKTTLDVIGLMAFGHDFKEACSFNEDTFGFHLRQWLDLGMLLSLTSIFPFKLPVKQFFINLSRYYLPKFLYYFDTIKQCYTTNKIHDLVENIVQAKIEDRRSGKCSETDSCNNKTLLDFILDATDTVDINNKEIHDVLMTFLIAGHETSTQSVSWSLYLLAQHQSYQERCRDEVNKFFALYETHLEWDDLKSLSFLNAVIHESLRLYPPVPWLHRVNINAEEIAGYYIPPNTDTLLLMVEMHRDPAHWTNPEEFVPERFLQPHDEIPWDAFMPFGDGVHKCIGYQLAMTETTYFLALLLKHFQFSLDTNVKYRDFAVITMQPRPILKLQVKPL